MPIATPPPSPPPILLSVLGTRFNPGSRITVHLVAPPNGQAFALVCDSAQHYRLDPSKAAPTTYTGTVPAPLETSTESCPISAEFFGASGVWSYVAENVPIFIGAPIVEPVEYDNVAVQRGRDRDHKHNDTSPAHPSPSPAPTRIPQPIAPRATPAPMPTPRYHRDPDPVAVNTPAPAAPKPVEVAPRPEPRVETSNPDPKPTKKPRAQ